MIYGYCRISTSHQTVLNQRHEIQTFADKNNIKIDKWVDEVISSRKHLDERKLGKILKKLKKGDILIASELSRLGRNLLEVMGILQQCLEKDCQIWTLKENYRLGADIQSKVLAFAFGLASEIERQLISERTKNSLQRLKDEGKHLGRPYGFSYKKLQKRHDKIKELLDKNVSKSEIARLMGCTWQTLHRYIKDSIDTYSQNHNGCNF
jgi:DNA invertase Pin-like site-specific DNA recombinase